VRAKSPSFNFKSGEEGKEKEKGKRKKEVGVMSKRKNSSEI